MTEIRIPHSLSDIKQNLENLQINSSASTIISQIITFTLNLIMAFDFELFLIKNHTQRNGYREIIWKLPGSMIKILIPCARKGYYKPFFESLITANESEVRDKFMTQSYLSGVTIRDIAKVLKVLDYKPLQKSQVSHRIQTYLGKSLEDLRLKKIERYYPILFVDALYESILYEGHYNKMAVIVVYGIRLDGKRADILDIFPKVGESKHTYSAIFKRLKAIGLKQPILVVSDCHKGLVKAISDCFPGAVWQRCAVHLSRIIFKHLPKKLARQERQDFINAVTDVLFNADSKKQAQKRAKKLIKAYKHRFPKAVKIFEDGYMDSLSYFDFPKLNCELIRSTNAIERFNRSIRKRTKASILLPGIEAYLRQVVSYINEFVDSTLEKTYFAENSLIETVENHRELLSDVSERVKEALKESDDSVVQVPTRDNETVCFCFDKNKSPSRESVLLQMGRQSFSCLIDQVKINIQAQTCVLVDSQGCARSFMAGLSTSGSKESLTTLLELLDQKDLRLICVDELNCRDCRMIYQFFPNVRIQSDLEGILDECLSFIPKKSRSEIRKDLKNLLIHSNSLDEFNKGFHEFLEKMAYIHPDACKYLKEHETEIAGCFHLDPLNKPVRKMMSISMVEQIFDLVKESLGSTTASSPKELAKALIQACLEMNELWQGPKKRRAIKPEHFLPI